MKPDLFYSDIDTTKMESTIAKKEKNSEAKGDSEENEKQSLVDKESNTNGFVFMNNPFRNLNAVYTLSALADLLLEYRPTGNERREIRKAVENHNYEEIKDIMSSIRSKDYLHL